MGKLADSNFLCAGAQLIGLARIQSQQTQPFIAGCRGNQFMEDACCRYTVQTYLPAIFDAAESACQYYSENIRTLSGRQEEICRTMERETREKCDRMLEQAKQMARVYWDEYKEKCNNYMKSMETAQRAAEISECSQMEAI